MIGQIGDLLGEVQQLYSLEAMLLDECRFDEWLELFTDDLHYVMPVPINRTKNFKIPDHELNLLEETLGTLRLRTARAQMDTAWSERPPSRTVHMVSNVHVREVINNDELAVRSAFLVYRHRLADEVEMFAGHRDDVLTRAGSDRWRVQRRVIQLAANTLPGKNLSVLF